MIKTITIDPDHEDPFNRLMDQIGFKCINRYMSGGEQSEILVTLTFEGSSLEYHENLFFKIENTRLSSVGYNYYSLQYLRGVYLYSDQEFFDVVANKHKFEFIPIHEIKL